MHLRGRRARACPGPGNWARSRRRACEPGEDERGGPWRANCFEENRHRPDRPEPGFFETRDTEGCHRRPEPCSAGSWEGDERNVASEPRASNSSSSNPNTSATLHVPALPARTRFTRALARNPDPRPAADTAQIGVHWTLKQGGTQRPSEAAMTDLKTPATTPASSPPPTLRISQFRRPARGRRRAPPQNCSTA